MRHTRGTAGPAGEDPPRAEAAATASPPARTPSRRHRARARGPAGASCPEPGAAPAHPATARGRRPRRDTRDAPSRAPTPAPPHPTPRRARGASAPGCSRPAGRAARTGQAAARFEPGLPRSTPRDGLGDASRPAWRAVARSRRSPTRAPRSRATGAHHSRRAATPGAHASARTGRGPAVERASARRVRGGGSPRSSGSSARRRPAPAAAPTSAAPTAAARPPPPAPNHPCGRCTAGG